VFKGPNISPAAIRTQQCLTCHQAGLRMNWQGSQHQRNDLACNSCHTIHIAKDPILVKFTQPQKCFTCHAEQRADSFKYTHHPIREGLVVCADCHNPHGSPGPKLLKEFTVNETCYTCHMEKRGPVLWEHQPVRENCLNCHAARLHPAGLAGPACAVPLPGLPRRKRPSGAADGRSEPARADRRQPTDDGQRLCELPLADPRLEQPQRRFLHTLGPRSTGS
jgi:predicted CXXCH cytochrome family protein